MALARTSLLGQISGASGTFGSGSFVTSSFTPPDNSLLVVSVSLIENGGANPPLADLTISGGGLTYTARASDSADTAFATSTVVYTAPVITGASMTLTLDCGARSVAEYSVSVVAYTGHNAASPVGATAIGHQVGGFGAAPTAASITLTGAPAATSEVVAAVGMDKSVAGVTPGSGWTELHDAHNTDWGGLETQYRGGSTSATVAWVDLRTGGGALFNFAAAAIEIKATTGLTQAIGTAAETNTAQALGKRKTRTVGVATETSAAQPLGKTKTRAVGLAGETSTAQPLGRTKTRTLGVTTTTETALPLGKAKTRPLGTAVEVNTAQPLGGSTPPAAPVPGRGQVQLASTGTAVLVHQEGATLR